MLASKPSGHSTPAPTSLEQLKTLNRGRGAGASHSLLEVGVISAPGKTRCANSNHVIASGPQAW